MSEQNRHNDQSEYYDHNVRVHHIDCTLTPPPAKNKELNKQMMKDRELNETECHMQILQSCRLEIFFIIVFSKARHSYDKKKKKIIWREKKRVQNNHRNK
jgi:hypothetical protein